MVERSMFYEAGPKIFEKAKWLRQNMTRYEKLLWDRLKSNQLLGLRFKSQHPIYHYIADFYCHKIRLVVEIDGESHQNSEQIEYDNLRNDVMYNLGLTVMRFTNKQVDEDMTEVLEGIKAFAQKHII